MPVPFAGAGIFFDFYLQKNTPPQLRALTLPPFPLILLIDDKDIERVLVKIKKLSR